MPGLEIHDADSETITAALNGPHGEWDGISIELEGARFHKLHEVLASPEFMEEEKEYCEKVIAELMELAENVGYGDANAFCHRSNGLDGRLLLEDPKLKAEYFAVFQRPPAGDYFDQVIVSEILLAKAAATPEARRFINFEIGSGLNNGPIHGRMSEAYSEGRKRGVLAYEASHPKP